MPTYSGLNAPMRPSKATVDAASPQAHGKRASMPDSDRYQMFPNMNWGRLALLIEGATGPFVIP